MIHSPALFLSLPMMPTNASSQLTLRTGRCRVIRADTSFSCVSGVLPGGAFRGGGAKACKSAFTNLGVNALPNRRCTAEITCRVI
jgi:hypothetical protein